MAGAAEDAEPAEVRGVRGHAVLAAGAAAMLAIPLVSEVRIARAAQPLSERWRHVPIEPRGITLLGLSYRPLQAEALGLDARQALHDLLALPFHVIRLGAYWNRLETEPGALRFDELDEQVAFAERAGKQIILNVGAVKTFGYPECFVPSHYSREPLREGALVTPETHPGLLDAARTVLARIVERYREHASIVAWQVEHEAVDPLGVEHSWRLAAAFVREEVRSVRAADPTRPILMNGFLPTSTLVAAQQWWRTRDQGDSLAMARQMADMIGIDYYPRHALVRVGPVSAYLDGSRGLWQQRRALRQFTWAGAHGRQLVITEGQAEPWEAVTTPPNPTGWAPFSCTPDLVIEHYNQCMRWARRSGMAPRAYLFWGTGILAAASALRGFRATGRRSNACLKARERRRWAPCTC